MNQTLRSLGNNTTVRNWAAVAPLDAATLVGGFSSRRLQAFKTRFAPSVESVGKTFSNVALTASLYVAIALIARELSTANVAPLLHALHLNGV